MDAWNAKPISGESGSPPLALPPPSPPPLPYSLRGGGTHHPNSFIIHDISSIYHYFVVFVVFHPLSLISLPNESLVQMISNYMLTHV